MPAKPGTAIPIVNLTAAAGDQFGEGWSALYYDTLNMDKTCNIVLKVGKI